LKRQISDAESELDEKAYSKYPQLTEAEVQALVVDDKWMSALDAMVHGELDRISQQLTTRVRELADRYQQALATLSRHAGDWEAKVQGHLERMGFAWT
jgi:type I restriction enzyme M protein